MGTKQIILCTLMILTSCAAVLLLAPGGIAKDDKRTTPGPMELDFTPKALPTGMAGQAPE